MESDSGHIVVSESYSPDRGHEDALEMHGALLWHCSEPACWGHYRAAARIVCGPPANKFGHPAIRFKKQCPASRTGGYRMNEIAWIITGSFLA